MIDFCLSQIHELVDFPHLILTLHIELENFASIFCAKWLTMKDKYSLLFYFKNFKGRNDANYEKRTCNNEREW